MTSMQVFALLAVLDLLGLLVTLWAGILPVMLGWVLIVLVASPLWEMMRPAFGRHVRELMPVIDRQSATRLAPLLLGRKPAVMIIESSQV